MKLLLVTTFILLPLSGNAEYLGNLSTNEFAQDSIANPFGAGSPFSPNSVTNEFSRFGSPPSAISRPTIPMRQMRRVCMTNKETTEAN